MQIRMRFFAVLKERAGCDSERLSLPVGTTAAGAMRARFPDLSLPVGFARNGELCKGETALSDGDELALLPPIGGG